MAVTTPTQIRIPDDVKRDAKARAEAEGTKLSAVATALLREYGAGRVDLPEPPKTDPDQQ